MEKLKEQLKQIQTKMNENLDKRRKLREEYDELMQESVDITNAYFQQRQLKKETVAGEQSK